MKPDLVALRSLSSDKALVREKTTGTKPNMTDPLARRPRSSLRHVATRPLVIKAVPPTKTVVTIKTFLSIMASDEKLIHAYLCGLKRKKKATISSNTYA